MSKEQTLTAREKLIQEVLIQEVIIFLIANEQYGDDWSEHIDALNELLNQNKDDKERS